MIDAGGGLIVAGIPADRRASTDRVREVFGLAELTRIVDYKEARVRK